MRRNAKGVYYRPVVGSAMANKNVVSAAAFSPDNPALREAILIAEEPNPSEDPSPLAVLRDLFANLVNPEK